MAAIPDQKSGGVILAPQSEDRTIGKARDWCFTFFYKDGEKPKMGERCSYLVAGKEETKEGKKHWQGYAEFENPLTIKGVQERLGIGKSHCEARNGTPQQAKDYCLKMKGEFIELGTIRPGQGARTDIKGCIKDAAEMSRMDLIQKWGTTYARARGTMEDVRQAANKVKAYKVYRKITYATPEHLRPEDIFWFDEETKWNGYCGESCVVIDRSNKKEIKRLMKPVPIYVNVKFGGEWLVAEWIVLFGEDGEDDDEDKCKGGECGPRPDGLGGRIWCERHTPK